MVFMRVLRLLFIDANQLSSTIPQAVISSAWLSIVLAHGNRLSGPIPHNLKSITFLVVNDNQLTGTLECVKRLNVLTVVGTERMSRDIVRVRFQSL